MKWIWFCKCGQQIGEAEPNEDFCLFNCFSCGKKQGRAIKRQVFSVMEKLEAWYHKENLIPKEVLSITEVAETKRVKKEHPDGH